MNLSRFVVAWLALGRLDVARESLAALVAWFDVQPATCSSPAADARQVAGLLQHWEHALTAIAYLDPLAPRKLMPRLNQLFNRAAVSQEEVHILRGVAKAMLQAAGRARS